MMSLALSLTLVVFFTELFSLIPSAALSEMLWNLWTMHSRSQGVRNMRAKRDELMKVREERSHVSSQDEFAKWARLDRQHQQLKKEYDVMLSQVGADRAKFNTTVRTLRWLATSGLRWGVKLCYRKTPVVWLPYGVLPYYVEWFLAFPSTPIGSISAVTWVVVSEITISYVLKLIKRAREIRV